MKVVGIDPGKSTGVAVAEGDGDAFTFRTLLIKEYDVERDRLIVRGASAVVCEDFILDSNVPLGGSRMWSSEGIGYWRALCMVEGVPFILQNRIWKGKTDKAQKGRLKFFTGIAPRTTHERDALAHVVAFMQRHSEKFPYIERKTAEWLAATSGKKRRRAAKTARRDSSR